jgi:hypothetical protein
MRSSRHLSSISAGMMTASAIRTAPKQLITKASDVMSVYADLLFLCLSVLIMVFSDDAIARE